MCEVNRSNAGAVCFAAGARRGCASRLKTDLLARVIALDERRLGRGQRRDLSIDLCLDPLPASSNRETRDDKCSDSSLTLRKAVFLHSSIET
jgi:hypothetical protein